MEIVTGRPRPRPPLEKQIQYRVKAVYEAAGCAVYWLSQPGLPRGKAGRRGTYQTAGLPDLLVYYLAGHGKGPMMFWHEVKRPGGKLSPAQEVHQLTAARCGVTVVVGGVDEAVAYLQSLGVQIGATA